MIRLVLVGYGRIAPKHLEAFRAHGCEFTAVCNRTEAGRQRAQQAGQIPRAYASIPEMLERERPDGVICCVSFDQVYHAAQQILPFGIPTLLEKPPGTSLAEFDHLHRLAHQHSTQVMVGFNRRYYSVLQNALADAGGHSALTAVFVEWSEDPQYLLTSRGFLPDQVSRWIFANSLHGLDLLTYLAGEIPQPELLTVNHGEPFRWLMSVQGLSRQRILGTFQSTWDSPGPWRLTFCTAGRRYTFAPLESCEVRETGTRDIRQIEPADYDRQYKPGFYSQAKEFLRLVRGEHAPAEDLFATARPAMRLADALTKQFSPHHKPESQP